MKVCVHDGCTKKYHARGLCTNHYANYKARGWEFPSVRRNTQGMSVDASLRFYGWTVTDSGCWEFEGNRFSNGYGQLYVDGRKLLTHRLAYEAWVGPIPEGQVIRHKCDNKPCLNPDHLETGTEGDNKRDAVERGQISVGEASANSKLNEAQVREIRVRYAKGKTPYAKMGVEYGLSASAIHLIVTRRNWKHVED